MKVHLQYGKTGLAVDLPTENVTLLQPKFVAGLADEKAAFQKAVRQPIGSKPLKEIIRANEKIAVVIPDITRPLPNEKLLTWLFEELDHVPAKQITIINGTGSHRVNTDEELVGMVGKDVFSKYRIINHNAHDPSTLAMAGTSSLGHKVKMNREYVEADRRIIMGFIEPHFIAGFSGGYKAVFPGVADIDSIMHYHGAMVISDPKSNWGVLDGNPTQNLVRQNGSVLPVDFCINLTLNRNKEITQFFCGETLQAHHEGCVVAKEDAMVACEKRFPIMITTNGGYPLDQNLYQAVKGMSAAAQIIEKNGFMISACKCNDGFPSHGNFRTLLFDHASPEAILKTINTPGFSVYDQWEAQLLAMVLIKCKVGLFSDISPEEVKRAHLEPVKDIRERIRLELEKIGKDASIAVLPEGHMTIPYLR